MSFLLFVLLGVKMFNFYDLIQFLALFILALFLIISFLNRDLTLFQIS